MTKIQLISGVVYTELQPQEVRQYLAGGTKSGVIRGYTDETKTVPILIAIHAVEYIYE